MKVSVIIPCYNVELYIKDCLRSVIAQTHDDMEIICVDDGSTDATVGLIEEIKRESSKPILLLSQSNSGAAAARNHGLKNATGDYIQFLDADDLLKPEKIASQVKLAVENNFPNLIIGSYDRKRADGSTAYQRIHDDPKANIWINLMRTDLGITSSNLWKRAIFETVGNWNESLGSSQEYELMFRILKHDPKLIFDKNLNTVVRERVQGAISQTNLSGNWNRYVKLRIEILEYIDKTGLQADRKLAMQIIFDAIRILYQYDPGSAKKYFINYIPKDFRPTVSASTGKLYCFLFRIFGFEKSEKIRSLF